MSTPAPVRRSVRRRQRRRPQVEEHDGYRLVIGGPVPPQAAAMTLGRTIMIRPEWARNEALLAHELVHVDQFNDLGWFRFMLRYVGPYLRFRLAGHGHMAAYRRIPLEVEASWKSRIGPDEAGTARARGSVADGGLVTDGGPATRH